MALITFTSDFGYSDHYVAMVKAKILSLNSNLQIVDISHDIERFNLAHGSHVISKIFREFPAGTVHIVAINSHSNLADGHIAIKLEDHFFVGSDNGIFGLISDQDPSQMVTLDTENHQFTSFAARDIFAKAAVQLASGKKIQSLGSPCTEIKRMLRRQIKATKSQISGNVIRVDHYGNLITNIDRDVFETLNKTNHFSVVFGREQTNRIHEGYDKTEAGDCFVIFNSSGQLEIGINKGSASELLGLGYDSPISITFQP